MIVPTGHLINHGGVTCAASQSWSWVQLVFALLSGITMTGFVSDIICFSSLVGTSSCSINKMTWGISEELMQAPFSTVPSWPSFGMAQSSSKKTQAVFCLSKASLAGEPWQIMLKSNLLSVVLLSSLSSSILSLISPSSNSESCATNAFSPCSANRVRLGWTNGQLAWGIGEKVS